MFASDLITTPRITEALAVVSRLTMTEKLLVARLLLDSVLEKEVNEESDWQRLSLAAFEKDWDNEDDAIYDNWRELYGVPAR